MSGVACKEHLPVRVKGQQDRPVAGRVAVAGVALPDPRVRRPRPKYRRYRDLIRDTLIEPVSAVGSQRM